MGSDNSANTVDQDLPIKLWKFLFYHIRHFSGIFHAGGIGDKAFGYYRYPDKGDFRASGAGNYEKKDLPEEAIRLAIDIKKKLNSRLMGIDFLYSNHAKQYFVIETSLFNQIDTPEQLVVDGVAGYYDISSDKIVFKEGKFWIQELLMQLLVEEWCLEFNK